MTIGRGEADRLCSYDKCCHFTPGSYNARYCQEHRCKRKLEAAKKRLLAPAPGEIIEFWKLQERQKLARFEVAKEKNAWLLANSRIGGYDLEASNLDGSLGIILCGCVKDRGGRTRTYVAERNRQGLLDDHSVSIAIRDDIESLDYTMGFYSTGFDLPFLNTRLIVHGERPVKQIRHVDLYFVARTHLKLHSNRLQVVGETLFGDSGKTRVIGPIWTRAMMGDRKSMKYIVEHCQADVAELEKAFDRLVGFVNLSATRWRVYGGSY